MKNNQYIEFYTEVRDTIAQRSCPVMNAHREEALRIFSEHGFPSKKVERYKYTDVAQDFAPDYGIQLSPIATERTEFCRSVKEADIDLAPYYNNIADNGDAVVALNTMLAVDALLIHVPRNTRAKHPIQINNVLKGKQDTMTNRRVLIVAEEHAEVKLLFCDHAADDQQFLTTQVMEVYAGPDSSIEIYGLEETHQRNTLVANTYIRQADRSQVRHNLITLHNGKTRQTTHLTLAGEGAECWANGAVIADKDQHVDNNTLIDHKAPNCTSNEMYKYVLDGKATGAFAGRILVREGAQKTASKETNANLCATRTARMYTQPMLEIYADDVKCSHGATIGRLNEEEQFYMRSRGITLEDARVLQMISFIAPVLENIPEDEREAVAAKFEEAVRSI